MIMPHLDHVAIWVADLDEARDFYSHWPRSFIGWLSGVWVASLPVSWLGLCRLGVTACRVWSRGGRAFPGARGFFLQDRGGQEAGAVCLRSR